MTIFFNAFFFEAANPLIQTKHQTNNVSIEQSREFLLPSSFSSFSIKLEAKDTSSQ